MISRDTSSYVLIISGCISPDEKVPNLVIRDYEVRKSQYIESIKWFISNSIFKKIVYCDNSNQPVDISCIECANRENKQFEWLSFVGDKDRVILQGKGYGEGECLAFAIENSHLINKNDYLCKVTGRLIIKNINSFINKINSHNIYCGLLHPKFVGGGGRNARYKILRNASGNI